MPSSPHDPRHWFDSLIGACFSIILVLVGLYWATSLIASVWPIILAILGTTGLLVGGIVAWRIWRNSRY